MRTTVALGDRLLDCARDLTGTRETAALLREALTALVERESVRRLGRLGGTMPRVAVIPRWRPDDAAG